MKTKQEWLDILSSAPPLSLPVGGFKSVYSRGLKRIDKYYQWGYINDDSAVFDLGCGIGADAIGLEQHEGWRGIYVGIDAKDYCIRFLNKHFTTNRYQFSHSDIRNPRYNPRGKINTLDYSLPVSNASMDFVMAHSFFSHTGPLKYARHYLRQIWRVLKDGGLAMTTWYFGSGEAITNNMKRTVYHQLDIETTISPGFDIVTLTEANAGKQTKLLLRKTK